MPKASAITGTMTTPPPSPVSAPKNPASSDVPHTRTVNKSTVMTQDRFYRGDRVLDASQTVRGKLLRFFSMKSLSLAIIVSLLIMSAGVAVVWTSTTMEGEVSRRAGSSLETVLNTTHEALRTWQGHTTASVRFIAEVEELRTAVARQIRVPHERSGLIHSEGLRTLRQLLRPYVNQRGYIDFAVISSDGTQIASGLDEFL